MRWQNVRSKLQMAKVLIRTDLSFIFQINLFYGIYNVTSFYLHLERLYIVLDLMNITTLSSYEFHNTNLAT